MKLFFKSKFHNLRIGRIKSRTFRTRNFYFTFKCDPAAIVYNFLHCFLAV